jgi:hypothetical protein
VEHIPLTFEHALLISGDSTVADACTQLAPRFQATLTIVDRIPPFVYPHADLVLWHTHYPLDHAAYHRLRAIYARVLAIYRRPPGGERLGPFQPFIQFIIFPFDLEDAYELIRSQWKRAAWP